MSRYKIVITKKATPTNIQDVIRFKSYKKYNNAYDFYKMQMAVSDNIVGVHKYDGKCLIEGAYNYGC